MKIVKQYDDNFYVELTCAKPSGWNDEYILKKCSNDGTIIVSKKMEPTRCIAYCGKSNDAIVIVKLDYYCDHSSVIVEYYEMNNSSLEKTTTHVIQSDFTINNTMIKVAKLNENLFKIVWSDPFNYDYVQLCDVSKEKIVEQTLKSELITEFSFESLYVFNDKKILSFETTIVDEGIMLITMANIINQSYCDVLTRNIFKNVTVEQQPLRLKMLDIITHNLVQYVLLSISFTNDLNYYLLFEVDFSNLILMETSTNSEFEPSIAIVDDKPIIFNSEHLGKFVDRQQQI